MADVKLGTKTLKFDAKAKNNNANQGKTVQTGKTSLSSAAASIFGGTTTKTSATTLYAEGEGQTIANTAKYTSGLGNSEIKVTQQSSIFQEISGYKTSGNNIGLNNKMQEMKDELVAAGAYEEGRFATGDTLMAGKDYDLSKIENSMSSLPNVGTMMGVTALASMALPLAAPLLTGAGSLFSSSKTASASETPSQVNAAQVAKSNNYDEVSAANQQLSAEVAGLQGEQTQVNAQVTALQGEIQTLTGQKETEQALADSAKKVMGNQKQAMETNEQGIKDCENGINDLTSQLNSLNPNSKTYAADKAKIESEINKLRQQKTQYEENYKQAKAKYEEAEKTFNEKTKSVETLTTQIETKNKHLTTLQEKQQKLPALIQERTQSQGQVKARMEELAKQQGSQNATAENNSNKGGFWSNLFGG